MGRRVTLVLALLLLEIVACGLSKQLQAAHYSTVVSSRAGGTPSPCCLSPSTRPEEGLTAGCACLAAAAGRERSQWMPMWHFDEQDTRRLQMEELHRVQEEKAALKAAEGNAP